MAVARGMRAEPDAATIQAALYRIADMASAASDLREFYGAMHQIVSELTYGENLFIALYDEENLLLNYPYYADSVDLEAPDPDVWEPMGTGQARGATAYVLRKGETVHMPADVYKHLLDIGEMEAVGVPGNDWIGVPLKVEGKAIGVLVVQTYEDGQDYSRRDVELMTFVGQHIASALSRARAISETRRLLSETNERAAELTRINGIQDALYRITEMASAARDMPEFYAGIQRIVGELMFAE